nr:GAF domain-containing protein [Kineosporia mesophila]
MARTITTSRWPTAESFDWARDGSPVGRLEHTADESAAGRLLDLLIETPDLNDLLGAAADLAVESLPGCDYASITVIRDGAPATVASSDERAAKIDELQYNHGQGPCLQAARTDQVVQVPDLSSTTWDLPWKDAAAAIGIHSALALPIASDADIAAALNLFSTRPGAWPASTQAMGEELALYIGSAITLAYRRNLA